MNRVSTDGLFVTFFFQIGITTSLWNDAVELFVNQQTLLNAQH
ncbi:hypothetical protein WKK05_24135 [Nostoc sp. UHCC 0302]